MSSQKPAKRSGSLSAAGTEAKKMKRIKKTKPNLSYLKSCADAPDIFFNVRNGNNALLTFPAHMRKLESLEEGSVLRVMAEFLAEQSVNLDLPDFVTPAGFQAVIRKIMRSQRWSSTRKGRRISSLYDKTVYVNEDNVLDIVAASLFCMVENPEEVLEFVKDNESDDVALKGLALCHTNGAYGTAFENKRWERFDEWAEDGLKSTEFLKVDVRLLAKILQRSSLKMDDECVVWNAACEWAKHQLKTAEHPVTDEAIREQLGDAFFRIRFSEMTPRDFANGPNKSGVLTDKEKLSVWTRRYDTLKGAYHFDFGSRRQKEIPEEEDDVDVSVEYVHVSDDLYMRIGTDPWSTASCDSDWAEYSRKRAYRCICGRVNEIDGYRAEDKPHACIYCGIRVYPHYDQVEEVLSDDGDSEDD